MRAGKDDALIAISFAPIAGHRRSRQEGATGRNADRRRHRQRALPASGAGTPGAQDPAGK